MTADREARTAFADEPRALLLVGAALGLIVGLLEVLARAVTERIAGWPLTRSPDGFWLTPIVHLVWLSIFGAVLAFGVRRLPWFTPRLGMAVLIFLGSLELLLDRPRLHQGAALVLAAGLGFRLSSWAIAHQAGTLRFARRSGLAGLTITVVLTAAICGKRWIDERQAEAGLSNPGAGATSVLLLVLDTVRGESMSLYGYNRPTTPELARWAERGVTFRRAYAAAPWTLPSHVAMFSGEWPSHSSANWLSRLDSAHPMIAEAFAGRGYMTAGFIANLLYCARQTGLARGFAHYEDYPLDWGAAAMSTGIGRALLNNPRVRTVTGYYDSPSRKHGSRMNRDLLRWLDDLDGRPFFAFVNYFDAHEPYLPAPRLEAAWATNSAARRFDLFRYFGHEITLTATRRAGPAALTREHDAYDASLAGLDADIGALLTTLETRGLLKNTVVIITADHGEQFGEHGLYRHGNSLYPELLQVPLIIFGPGIPAGVWVDEPVSLRDLAGTMLDLTGHPDARFPGRSLARTWTAGAKTPPDQPLAELISSNWETDRTVIAGTEQFIHPSDGKDELYDLERDSATTMNLLADSLAAPRAVAYRALLDSVLGPAPRGPR